MNSLAPVSTEVNEYDHHRLARIEKLLINAVKRLDLHENKLQIMSNKLDRTHGQLHIPRIRSVLLYALI